MNILILGSGGREHALAWKLSQSPLCAKLYAAPGNPGIAEAAELASLDAADHAAVITFCEARHIGLVVIGPEAPLVKHTHPGKEIIYILEGSLEYQVEGQPTRTFHAGEALTVPAGAVHAVRNVGSGNAAELATYVVEKGKPVLTLAG